MKTVKLSKWDSNEFLDTIMGVMRALGLRLSPETQPTVV